MSQLDGDRLPIHHFANGVERCIDLRHRPGFKSPKKPFNIKVHAESDNDSVIEFGNTHIVFPQTFDADVQTILMIGSDSQSSYTVLAHFDRRCELTEDGNWILLLVCSGRLQSRTAIGSFVVASSAGEALSSHLTSRPHRTLAN
jgi:hypothetical protein